MRPATVSGMLKNLYIRKGDENFWTWAQTQADAKDESLSTWISNLIRVHKMNVGLKVAKESLTVDEMISEVEQTMAHIRTALVREEIS